MKTFIFATVFLMATNSIYALDNERWNIPRLWREKIEKGLSEQEVMGILGKPLYTHRSSTQTVMCYQYIHAFTPPEKKDIDRNTKDVDRNTKEVGELRFPSYGTVVLSNEIKEEKPQIKEKKAEEESQDNSQAIKQVEQEAKRYRQKGEYYDKGDPRKIEKKRRNNEELTKAIHKVVGWEEPNWNNIDTRDSAFLFPDSETIKSEKWQDPLMWKRLRLNLPENSILKMMGEPSKQNRGVQSSTNAEQNIDSNRSLRKGEWLLYGEEYFGGILKFRYDHKESKYLLAYWSEPYWPEIMKQDIKKNTTTVPVEPNTPMKTDKIKTKTLSNK